MEDHSFAYSRPVRIIGLILSFAALSFWTWISSLWVEGVLDYPLRRAGENDDYPPLHTFKFYTNCAWELGSYFLLTSYLWLIPFVVTMIGLCFGLNVQSYLKRTCLILSSLIAPIIVSSIYWIFIVY